MDKKVSLRMFYMNTEEGFYECFLKDIGGEVPTARKSTTHVYSFWGRDFPPFNLNCLRSSVIYNKALVFDELICFPDVGLQRFT